MIIATYCVCNYNSYSDYFVGIYENLDSIENKDYKHMHNEKHKNDSYPNLYFYKEFNTLEEYNKAEWRLI